MSKIIPNLQILLMLVFISLLILTLDSLKLLQLPKTAAYYLTNPVSFGFYKTRQVISGQFSFIFLARKAGQENKALQEQIGQLVSENAKLRSQLTEAQAYLDQSQSLDPRTYNLMPTRPVGVDRYLKIDKGENDGVKLGWAVVFKDNFIGQVVSVSTKRSNVRLLTDPDSKLSAFSIGSEGRAKGVVRGDFGLEMVMDKILHEEKIGQGDLVYSEGTEGFLPRGLILGRIVEVKEVENELFKQAKLKPVFDIKDLELVFLIQN